MLSCPLTGQTHFSDGTVRRTVQRGGRTPRSNTAKGRQTRQASNLHQLCVSQAAGHGPVCSQQGATSRQRSQKYDWAGHCVLWPVWPSTRQGVWPLHSQLWPLQHQTGESHCWLFTFHHCCAGAFRPSRMVTSLCVHSSLLLYRPMFRSSRMLTVHFMFTLHHCCTGMFGPSRMLTVHFVFTLHCCCAGLRLDHPGCWLITLCSLFTVVAQAYV